MARNRVNGKTIAAHAGRYSLVDRQRLLGKSPRQHESVVNAMVEELLTGDDGVCSDPSEIEAFAGLGIRAMNFAHDFNNPVYGQWNQLLITDLVNRYGRGVVLGDECLGLLNLHTLILKQFTKLGMPKENFSMDHIDTASDPDHWFSRVGGDQTGHNHIFVVNRA